jgi:tetratricopeptide (TPR) repeat protein
MRRKLNVKFLACMILSLAACGVGVHFLHAYQVKRNAGALLDTAVEAEKNALDAEKRASEANDLGNLTEAKHCLTEARHYLMEARDCLSNYVALAPWNDDALARLGFILEKTGKSPRELQRVYLMFEKVIRLDPSRNDVREQLAEIAIRFGRFSDAREHLEKLTKNDSSPGKFKVRLGQCCEKEGDFKAAMVPYKGAVRDDPRNIDAYVSLAYLLRGHSELVGELDSNLLERVDLAAKQLVGEAPKKGGKQSIGEATRAELAAEIILEEMIGKNSQNFQAYMARASYWKDHKSPEKAAADIKKAIQLAPKEAEVILAAAESDLDWLRNPANSIKGKEKEIEDKLASSRKLLREGIEFHPKNAAMYRAMAMLELINQHPQEAIDVLGLGLKAVPDNLNTSPNKKDLVWSWFKIRVDQARGKEQIESLKHDIESTAEDLPDHFRKRYLDARLQMKSEKWSEALNGLKNVRSDMTQIPELIKEVDLELALCYQNLGNSDEQMACYKRILSAEPSNLDAAQGMVRVLTASGNFDQAIEICRANERLRPATPQLLIAKNLRLPKEQRNWQAKELAPGNLNALQNAEVLAGQNHVDKADIEKARKGLIEACKKQPKKVEFWTALIALEDRHGDLNQALAKAENELGPRPELFLLRIQHWVSLERPQPAEQAKAGLAQVEREITQPQEKTKNLSSQDRWTVLESLATAYLQVGKRDDAKRLWQQLLAERRKLDERKDLASQLDLFGLALQAGDTDAMEEVKNKIQTFEEEKTENDTENGKNGTWWLYCDVRAQLFRFEKGMDKKLSYNADFKAKTMTSRRPSWPKGPLCEAQIADHRGHQDEALKKYQQAISLGERSPAVIRRTAEILREHGRYDSAKEIFQKLPEIPSDLRRMASELSLQANDYGWAQELAKNVPSDSKDYRDQIWLAQVQWYSAEEKSEALKKNVESKLWQAIKLAEQVPDPWVSLVQFLVAIDRKSKAKEVILKAQERLPKDKTFAALGYCYELMGDVGNAKEQYKKALEITPDDRLSLERLTNLYMSTGDTENARAFLQKLKDQSPQMAADVNRQLAIMLVSTGKYKDSQDALVLLGLEKDKNVEEVADIRDGDSLEYIRTKAIVLSTQRKGLYRPRAIKVLNRLAHDQGGALAVEDQFLLAQLNAWVGNWREYDSQMLAIMANPNVPKHVMVQVLIHYAQVSLNPREESTTGQETRDLSRAQLCLNKLKNLDRDSMAATEIEARLLIARVEGKGNAEQAVAANKALTVVQDFVGAKSEERNARLLFGASLLESLSEAYLNDKNFAQAARELTTRSEVMYRNYEEAKPENKLALIGFLGRHGRLPEALNLSEQAWRTCPAESVALTVLVALRASGERVPQQLSRVESWLESAIAKNPKSASKLMVYIAELRDLQGRYAEAIELYRKVLVSDSSNAVALNNLAWLLALTEGKAKGEEALELVNRAISLVGPLPSLLDTRGVIYSRCLNNPDLGALDLEEAVAANPSAVNSWHLCLAYKKAENIGKISQAFERALKLGLTESKLHPLEKPLFRQFKSDLMSRTNVSSLIGGVSKPYHINLNLLTKRSENVC